MDYGLEPDEEARLVEWLEGRCLKLIRHAAIISSVLIHLEIDLEQRIELTLASILAFLRGAAAAAATDSDIPASDQPPKLDVAAIRIKTALAYELFRDVMTEQLEGAAASGVDQKKRSRAQALLTIVQRLPVDDLQEGAWVVVMKKFKRMTGMTDEKALTEMVREYIGGQKAPRN